jgi:hypothetical protein
MKKTLTMLMVFLIICSFAFGQEWTVESARLEAFGDLKTSIDVAQFPSFDPDFTENQKALREGRERVKDRFVTNEPSIGAYIVSKLDDKSHPKITMMYNNEGQLLTIRLFSGSVYPRKAYTYVVKGDEQHKPGKLLMVSFHVSSREMFNFTPQGECTAHINFNNKE